MLSLSLSHSLYNFVFVVEGLINVKRIKCSAVEEKHLNNFPLTVEQKSTFVNASRDNPSLSSFFTIRDTLAVVDDE